MSIDWQAVQAIGTLVGALLVAGSLGFAGYQLKEQRRIRAATVLKGLFDELHSGAHRTTLYEIYHLKDIDSIDADLNQRIEVVLNRLELIGFLVAEGIIEEQLALKLLRGQPLRCWYKLERYIIARRGPTQRGHYARFMEDFAIRSVRYQIKNVPENEWTSLDGVSLVQHFKSEVETGRWSKWEKPK